MHANQEESPASRSRPRIPLPTITELGAVTLVIAALGIAMVPAVVKARQQQEETTCLSNMKQLELGLLQYEQDYDERGPACYKGAPQGWGGRIWPYTQSALIYRCPLDQTSADYNLTPNAEAVSYGMNSNLRAKPASGKKAGQAGMSLADLTAPAVTVMLFEVAGDRAQITAWDEGTKHYKSIPALQMLSSAGDGVGNGPEWGYLGKGPSPIAYDAARHQGGSNWGATDGHVVWRLPSLVSSGVDNPKSDATQDDPKGAAAGTTGLTADPDNHFDMTFSTN